MSEYICAENADRLIEVQRQTVSFTSHLTWSPSGDALLVTHGGGAWVWQGDMSGPPTLRLEGHTAPVHWGTYSPDGRLIATASSDTTLRLWDAQTGALVSTLQAHQNAVESVVFTASGDKIISGDGEGKLAVIRLGRDPKLTLLNGHIRHISALACGQNGLLASGSRDNSARLWDLATGEQRSLLQHTDWVRDLALAPDGQTLATACKDGQVYLWAVEESRLQHTIAAHEGGVDALAFSGDGLLLASGGRDQQIRIWERKSGSALGVLSGHQKPVLGLAFHPAGRMLASASGDNSVRLWAVSSA